MTTPDHDPGAGEILTTNGPGPGQYGPLIYTPEGRLVWFEPLSGGQVAEDLSEQTFNGQRDLTWWKGRVLSLGFGQGEDVVMNSRYQVVARVRGGNGLQADLHEFQSSPATSPTSPPTTRSAATCARRKGSAMGRSSTRRSSRSTSAPAWCAGNGTASTTSERTSPKSKRPSDSTPWDYFHLNSIDPQPGGDLLISARSTWAAYQLQGGSGRILWRLGGTDSSFKMGPGTRMAWQHDGRMLPDGELTFFDDGSNPPIHSQSRGLRVALDQTHKVARLLFAYTHRDPPLLAASQGNMQTLANGNALVGYGGVPAISEFARGGSLLFDAHMPFDMSFYRAFRFPWRGRPAAAPAAAASLNNTGEETIVHASWNGATGVAAWRVLAGPTPGSLKAGSEIPSQSFESSLTLPSRFSYVQVQALDASGRTLASSERPVRGQLRRLAVRPSVSRPVWSCAGGWWWSASSDGLLFEEELLFPPQAAITKVIDSAARSVSMAVSGNLRIGRAPIVTRGLGSPPYQAPAAPPAAHFTAMSVDTAATPRAPERPPGERRADPVLAVAAGRLLRGAVHGHPRPEHRQRGAAAHPVEPRLLESRRCSGSSTRTRSPSPAF